MGHVWKHFSLVCRHRHHVIVNAAHFGIFFQALRHDLSKFGKTEFLTSAKYYVGDHSPVYEERLRNDYFSTVCQHHVRRNKHHWEYWTDFFAGRIINKSMPWNWAMEYVADVLSASYCYSPKDFEPSRPVAYFRRYQDAYIMTERSKTFIEWCLQQYADYGFEGLKKKITKAKYEEISKVTPEIEIRESLPLFGTLPNLKTDI